MFSGLRWLLTPPGSRAFHINTQHEPKPIVRTQKPNHIMKSLFSLILFIVLLTLDSLRRQRHVCCFANVVPGTVTSHPGKVTRRAEAALENRKRLVRQGTADDQVLLGTAAAKPLGWIDDIAGIGERLAVSLLGSSPDTAVLTAGGEIDAGDDVFAAANGKVTVLPVAAGTYWLVGSALTSAGADDDELEVDPCLPRPVVVSG